MLVPVTRKLAGLMHIALLVTCVLCFSCRRPDYILHKPSVELDSRLQFFKSPPTNSYVRAIFEKIKKQDEDHRFISEFVKWAGYPIWDKALLPDRASPLSRTDNARQVIVYIPFTQLASTDIDAVMIGVITDTNTSLKMVYRFQYDMLPYRSSGIRGATAEAFALFFMGLEKETFGHLKFQSSDTMLFSYGRPKYTNSIYVLDSFSLSRSLLFSFSFCTTEYYPLNGWNTGCDPGSPCNPYVAISHCESENFYDNGVSDNGSGFPVFEDGSGTGSGGYGWNENPCRSVAAAGDNPCNQTNNSGWQNISDTNLSPSQQPIDSLLAQCSRAINAKADSLFRLSTLHNNWEYCTTIVKQDNLIYGTNIKTDLDSNGVEPDLHIGPGETLLATLHVHNRVAVLDRSAPSHGDIYSLRFTNYKNFIEFVECGNVRYALIIQDPAKARSFYQTHSFEQLYQSLSAATFNQHDWPTNWQGATQAGVIATLSSVLSSGIGFYISINPVKTTYQLLNP